MGINSVLRLDARQDGIATYLLQSRSQYCSLIADHAHGQGMQPAEKKLNYCCPGDRRLDGRWWPWA